MIIVFQQNTAQTEAFPPYRVVVITRAFCEPARNVRLAARSCRKTLSSNLLHPAETSSVNFSYVPSLS